MNLFSNEQTIIQYLVKNIRILGILFISICLATWTYDLLTEHACIYCRVQRSSMGIIGLFMLAIHRFPALLKFLSLGVGILSIDTSGDQIFLVLKNIHAGNPFNLVNLVLATCALFMVLTQLITVLYYNRIESKK